jgi:predicted cobalt transporter CbtA
VGNCSCAACDAACPAPPVDATIAFFAGFDGILVGIVYGALIVFSIVFQLVRAKLQSKVDPSSGEEDASSPMNAGNADESVYRT